MWNQVKTVLLLGLLSTLLVAIGGAVSPTMLYVALGLALVMNLGAYWFSDSIILRMSGAREVSATEYPHLHAMVDELARNAQMPKPKVYVMADEQANAFATGRSPERGVVAVTEGIMRILSARELRGVIAHELAHIKNRDVLIGSIAAVMAAALSTIADMVFWASMFGGNRSEEEGEASGGGGFLMLFIAPFIGMLLQMAISRSREYMADAEGARISGDPNALADALAKLQRGAELVPSHSAANATASLYIVNPFAGMGGGLLSWFSTHPPMEQRITRLREMARNRGMG